MFPLRQSIFLLMFLVFCSSVFAAEGLTIEAPTYFEEQEQQFESIHYLSDELLSFSFCTDKKPITKQATVVCENGREQNLSLYEKQDTEDTCFFSNNAMETLPCSDFRLAVEYQTENKEKSFERQFVEQKQSKLITHILNEDIDEMDALSISYYLVVLNDLGQVNDEQSQKLYEQLKSMRNNAEKCWPKDDCDVDYTAKILRNLHFAGYDTTTRLLLDGRLYLNREVRELREEFYDFKLIFEQNEDYFDNNDDIECEIKPDEDSDEAENTTISDDYETENGEFSDELSVSCDATVDEITLVIYNREDEPFIRDTREDTNGFTYTQPSFSCIGQGDCNLSTTLHALSIYSDEDLEDKDELENYLSVGTLYDSKGDIYYTSDNPYASAGRHLEFQEQEELVDYLRFEQNNDGSWGDTDESDRENVKQTAWSILGLEARTDNSEYVDDAKDWIYFEEPRSGWSSIDRNVMAYLAIKEKIKPFLKISPENTLIGEITFNISNPTTYKLRNLELSLSDSIEDKVFYPEDLGDLEPGEMRNVTVSVDQSFFGIETGTLELTGIGGDSQDLDLVDMTVNIKGNAAFTIPEKTYQITEQDSTVPLEIKKHASSFSANCTLTNPMTNEEKSLTISQDTSTITLQNPRYQEGSIQGEITCQDESGSFTLPMEFTVELLPTEFSVDKKEVVVDSRDTYSLTITSTTDTEKQLTLEVTRDYNGILAPASENVTLPPGEEKTVSFTMQNRGFLDALGNQSSGNILISSDSGFSQKVSLTMTGSGSGEEEGGMPWWLIGIMLLVIVFIGLIGWRYYQLKKQEKEDKADEESGEEEIEL